MYCQLNTKEVNISTTATPQPTGYGDLSFYATRFRQGGRTVYSLELSIPELIKLIPKPDPARPTPGNRQIKKAHAEEFGKYIREHVGWVSPGLILRSPAMFEFEPSIEIAGAQFGLLAFPVRSMTEIHILDGQHRMYGFHDALTNIANDMDRSRDDLADALRNDPQGRVVDEMRGKIDHLKKQHDRLSSERVSIQIVVEADGREYKQIFADIADNSLGITASVKSMFDSRKVVNRSLQYVFEHPLLVGRVDTEAGRVLGAKNLNLMSAAGVSEIVRSITVGLDGRVSKYQEVSLDERGVGQKGVEFFNALTAAFPVLESVKLGQILPRQLRDTSLLGSILMLRILAGVYFELRKREWTQEEVTKFFTKLDPHMPGPVSNESIWTEHAPGLFDEGKMAPPSRRQDLALLNKTIVGWAIERPAWLESGAE